MAVIGLDHLRDLMQIKSAIRIEINWLGLHPAKNRRTATFVSITMRLLAGNKLFTTLTVREDRQ